jgi:anti-sigma factor RsiW
VTTRKLHLDEERLFECYVTTRSGDAIDPPAAEHLADCPACATQYAELAAFMEQVRADADAEADAVFTAERLRAQHQQIAKRLEHVGRAARVISFPGRASGAEITGARSRFALKWLAAAAAAGLFFGAALGASYEWESHARAAGRVAAFSASANRASRLTPIATRGTSPAAVADDDAFLSDLEAALERPRTRELLPFDQLTPHVRDISTQR